MKKNFLTLDIQKIIFQIIQIIQICFWKLSKMKNKISQKKWKA